MWRWLGLFVLLATVAVATPAAAQEPPEPPAEAPTGPRGVHIAYGADPSTAMTVAWTGPPADDAQVHYGPATLSERAAGTPEPLPGTARVAYHVTLDGLEPDTTYKYAVETNGNMSPRFTFSTAPDPDPGAGHRPFTFAAWGDHGVQDPRNPLAGPDTDAPNRNVKLARSLDPAFHVVPGDVSYANGYPPTWDRYFDTFQPYLAETPYMTVPGNHEREPGQGYTQYDARLKVPDQSRDRWYAFRYANVLVVGLDNGEMCREEAATQAAPTFSWRCGGGPGIVATNAPDEAKAPNPAQMNFIEAQLQRGQETASIDWTVVVHHYAAYSSAAHGSNPDVQRWWVPLYDEYGVDLVVNGHDHVYQRSKPLAGGDASEAGTTYVVSGAGGDGRYSFEEGHPEWEAARVGDTWGTTTFTVEGDRLTGRFLDLNGTVRDEFVLEDREEGGAAIVNLSEEREEDEPEEEPRDPPPPPPEPNREENRTDPGSGSNASTRDAGDGGGNATPQGDEAGGAIPAPGLAAALGAVLLAVRRRT
jgi:hypothetical protein